MNKIFNFEFSLPAILIFVFFEDEDGFWKQVKKRIGGIDLVSLNIDRRAHSTDSRFEESNFSNENLLIYLYEFSFDDANVSVTEKEITDITTIAVEELTMLLGEFHAVVTFDELFELGLEIDQTKIIGLKEPHQKIDFALEKNFRQSDSWLKKTKLVIEKIHKIAAH